MCPSADPLASFSPATRTWFQRSFRAPTAAQAGAWQAISAGQHTLIVAPTGSGKTLSAFLWALDRLHLEGGQNKGTQVLYISPLKALGVDVERNLRAPLRGIAACAQELGLEAPQIRLGVRSGDTPPRERRQLLAHPPDILMTTPESLYLMLTSQARSTLTGVHTVIIDEIHALAGSKRGAHLAVSLERLNQLMERPFQRIGLSATVNPVETVARFLGGTAPVEVVAPPSQKSWDLRLSVPVPDMTALGGASAQGQVTRPETAEGQDGVAATPESGLYLDRLAQQVQQQVRAFDASPSLETFDDGLVTSSTLADQALEDEAKTNLAENLAQGQTLADLLGIQSQTVPGAGSPALPGPPAPLPPQGQASGAKPLGSSYSPGSDLGGYQASIWPHIEEKLVDLIEANQSTIVFTNSRSLAEKVTARINEIYLLRLEARGLIEPQANPVTGARSYRVPANQDQASQSLTIGSNQSQELPPPLLARTHHGSVSKEQRASIEDALKAGQLRCVVATSSLELGIDMGQVDLVVQVESPHSVASGLQRVGRAGHQVGQTSRAYFYPKHRGDLLNSAVTIQNMLAGELEPLTIPTNPLDILAQQTLAACALGPIDVEKWFSALRATAPFASLPRSAFEATLDLLSGLYPSDEFAELRPRIIWDRDAGTIKGRHDAQRLAVTSGGTIPDRGLFPVYIAGADEAKGPKRVGELDEEMVYESRPGDVIALGASSWRIQEISHDRVTVTPAPGIPGRLPFWKGDSPGRPVALGQAQGRFIQEMASLEAKQPQQAQDKLKALGLDAWARDNLLTYLAQQQEATGQVPNHQHLLVERFRDEIGDWRLILHSPLGLPVHSPWALAVGARVRERYGVQASAMAADDGIVLRLPATDAEPPGADLFLFDPQELEELVSEQVGGSALFASRFRENAARALLLTRRNPGKRTPLWQQRQRSAQLLEVARKYPSFPLLLETARECLQDVYDLPALLELHRGLEAGSVRVSEVETETPSPFARSLLFGYTAQFLYEGDVPLAERRAAALALDPTLLAELLGKEELRELLDAEVIRSTETRLQRLDPSYRLRGLEGAADLLRLLGPLSAGELALRLHSSDSLEGAGTCNLATPQAQELLDQLTAQGRAFPLLLAGRQVYAVSEDAARLRDALGVPLPPGLPSAYLEPVADPLGDLLSRYARTHAPFTAAQAAKSLGLGVSVVETALRALADERRVSSGDFLPQEVRIELSAARTGSSDPIYQQGTEWVEAKVLRTLRSRSLATLRNQVEPVDPATYARFLPAWQHLASWAVRQSQPLPGLPARRSLERQEQETVSGYEGLLTVIDQLAGSRLPASALESLILPARIKDYQPTLLDQALASGEVTWSGQGQIKGKDGWVCLHLTETSPLTLPSPQEAKEALEVLGPLEEKIYRLLEGGHFFPQIQAALTDQASLTGDPAPSPDQISQALWNLVWAGLISNDSYAPVRALLKDGGAQKLAAPAPRARAVGMRRGAARLSASRYGLSPSLNRPSAATSNPLTSGRWHRLDAEPLDPTIAAHAQADLLMDRYGVLTRGALNLEDTPGGFAAIYKVLSLAEEKGLARRGYFIEGLGAAQFALPTTVDRLRSYKQDQETSSGPQTLHLLAACDPANPYGATLPWPDPLNWAQADQPTKHRPGRKAGACLILADGQPVLYLERGAKTLLVFTEETSHLQAATPLLAHLVTAKIMEKIVLTSAAGADLLAPAQGQDHPLQILRQGLLDAGFHTSPQGLRIRSS